MKMEPVAQPTYDEPEEPAMVDGAARILPPMPKGMTLPQITDAFPLVMPFGNESKTTPLPRPTDEQIDSFIGQTATPVPDGGF